MKLIDRDGRLFGKISILDVIVLVVAAVGMLMVTGARSAAPASMAENTMDTAASMERRALPYIRYS